MVSRVSLLIQMSSIISRELTAPMLIHLIIFWLYSTLKYPYAIKTICKPLSIENYKLDSKGITGQNAKKKKKRRENIRKLEHLRSCGWHISWAPVLCRPVLREFDSETAGSASWWRHSSPSCGHTLNWGEEQANILSTIMYIKNPKREKDCYLCQGGFWIRLGLFVCLSAGIHKNLWPDFHESRWKGVACAK